MAVTSLWAVKNRLDHVVEYAKDESKTKNKTYGTNDNLYDLSSVYEYATNSNKTEKQYYVTGINVNTKNAVQEMNNVKKKYNKSGGIIAFHGIQSFEEGELTPEIAHEVGVKLAEEIWGDRFQVVVTTHLNTKHLHNHFVINSVSFKDGYKYYSNYENTSIMRKISDDICREYGLSVIENAKSKKIDFDYFYNKSISKDEYTSFIKDDIDFAIKRAFSFDEFKKILKTIGYEFYFRAAQMSIRMQPKKRYLRVERNLGDEYSLQRIKERIYEEFIDLKVFYKTEYRTLTGYYTCKRNKVKSRAKGFIGLYKYYCYLLKVYPKRNWQHRLSFETREAIKQLNKYTNQLIFVDQNKIYDFNDLEKIRNSKTEKLQKAYNYRNRLYYSRKSSDNKEQFTEKIIEATKQINIIKSEIKICNDIQIEVVKIKEQIKEFYQKEDERKKNFNKTKKLWKKKLIE